LSIESTQQQAPLLRATNSNKAKAPNIRLQLPSYEVIGFLDTGSSVSAVSQKVANDLKQTKLKKPRFMLSANG